MISVSFLNLLFHLSHVPMFQGLKLQVTKKHSVQILYDQHRFTQLPWDTVGDFEPKEHMFEKHMAKCKSVSTQEKQLQDINCIPPKVVPHDPIST